MTINYRRLQETDFNGLIKLMFALGYTIEEGEFKKTVQEITKRDGVIFIAEKQSRVIGSSCAIIDARLAEGIFGEIVSLVISKELRGFGVGKQLVYMSEEWLYKRVNTIRIRANVIREDAHSFYNHLGYQEKKEQKVFIKTKP
jgi:GNAT superfamily N-acetyltransferase